MSTIDRKPLRRLQPHQPEATRQSGKTSGWPYRITALALRLAAVALLGRVIWIHLHLWQTGYKHIPTVGPLFLAGALALVGVAVMLLATPSRPLGLLALTLDAGILAALIGSIDLGLFGFTESLNAPFVMESIVVETLAGLALTLWVAVEGIAQHHRQLTNLAVAVKPHDRNDHPAPKTATTIWHEPSTPAA
jgi:hypothetical protein